MPISLSPSLEIKEGVGVLFERPLGSGENSRAKSWWGLWLVNDGLWGIEASLEM